MNRRYGDIFSDYPLHLICTSARVLYNAIKEQKCIVCVLHTPLGIYHFARWAPLSPVARVEIVTTLSPRQRDVLISATLHQIIRIFGIFMRGPMDLRCNAVSKLIVAVSMGESFVFNAVSISVEVR